MINGSPKPGRRGPRLVLALALGAAAAAGVYLYVTSVQQQAQQQAQAAAQRAVSQATVRSNRVVVAKVGLSSSTLLSEDNVELRDVASDAVQPNAATSLTEVRGKSLAVPVAAGEQILN